MATLGTIEGTNTVPENNDISQENFEILNEVKVESDLDTDYPALVGGGALNVRKVYALPRNEYDAITAPDANTLFLVFDTVGNNSGVYVGSILIANISAPCP